MKKILLSVVSCLLILITLAGCQAGPYPFKEPVSEIESIEIVSAESSLEFTVIKTLSETEKQIFLQQFKKIKFYDYLGDRPDVCGDAIKITYKSDIYEMICFFGAEYVENGVNQYRWESCDEDEFNELLNNFLE